MLKKVKYPISFYLPRTHRKTPVGQTRCTSFSFLFAPEVEITRWSYLTLSQTQSLQKKKNRIGLLMHRRLSFPWEVVRKRLRTEAAERQRLVCVIAALTYPFSNVFFPNTQLLNLIQKKKKRIEGSPEK